jgi:hypothetical protein
MRTLRLVLVLVVVFCFVSSLSYTQEIKRGEPCKADREKFCKEVKPGHGLEQCMKQHEGEFSPACKERIAVNKEKAQEWKKSCKPDAEKFCKDIKPGEGRIIRCLRQHHAELSTNCGGFLTQHSNWK